MSRLSVDENAGAGGTDGAGTTGTGGKSTGGNAAAGAALSAGTSSGGQGATDSGGSAVGGSRGGTDPNGDAGATAGGEDNNGGTTTGGTAGTGGSVGGSGGAPALCATPTACIDEVAGKASSFGNAGWKDSWWVVGCVVKTGYDCANVTSCSNVGATPEDRGARTVETWQLGGEKGQHYKVTFSFSGVTEGKEYANGNRDAAFQGNPSSSTGLDTFYRDGTSVESNYTVLKLTVYDDDALPVRHYYMNSGHLSWESHNTYLASYTKSIIVVGQGKIEHMVQDKNCRPVDNCGPDAINDSSCPAPRKLPGSAGNLLLPSKYQDPNDDSVKSTLLLAAAYNPATLAQPWHAQAAHLSITAIEKTNDPVTTNY